MNKLGFAIKLASQGAGNAIECNKGQWTSKVVDIREYLKLFNGLQGTDNIVTFMSFDDSGCFLTQLRAISGRVGDFLSGWIYIPNTIEATGEDVMNAYNYVRNILSQSNLSEYKEEIESFFSKEFPAKEFPAQYIASKGQLFGLRYLGHYTLKEIVGEHRYQPYYSNYKAVFLIDKEGDVKIAQEAASNFRNLTDKEIVKTAVLIPPTTASLQLLGKGTKLLTQDGYNFASPLLVNVGTTVSLVLSRIGFENLKVEVPVTSEKQNLDLTNAKVVWRKRISSSMFTVINSKHEDIKSVHIFVNGTDVTYAEVTLTEDECHQATVKVTAPDYETNEQKRNLLNEDLEIVLRRKIKSSRMLIELANGGMAEMTLESKDLSGNYESPLKGYEYEDSYGRNSGDKILRMSSWFVWKQRLWGFFAALIAVMLIIAYAAFDAWIDTHHFKFGLPPWEEDAVSQQYTSGGSSENNDSTQNQNDVQGDQESGDQQATTDISLEAAIKYLDNSSVWSKTEMENYPDLVGLFEDMNEFRLSNLLNEWHTKLASSIQFDKVCSSAQKTYSNHWNPKQGIHNPTYNKANDEQISLTNYINWLDQDQTSKNFGGSTGNSGTSGKTGNGAGKASAGKGTSGAAKGNSGNAKGGTNGDL